ncbi:MAG: DUF2141 domain-containing protein [Bacteroidota bacterium]
MQRYIILLFSCVLLMGISPTPIGIMELTIEDIKYNHGTLWIGIYPSEEAFLDKSQAKLVSVKAGDRNTQKIELDGLSYGDYAIALFHDLNDNDEMDLNWLGVPQEPFAFSRPAPSKWRLPEFSEVKVSFYQQRKTIHTKLSSWWDY